MSELKSCPFCGGEATILIEGKHGYYTFHHEGAHKCPAEYAHYADYATEAEAIKAWNTRAERTCEVKQHRCTKCDHEINDDAYFVRIDLGDGLWTADSRRANYCPNCGAKVVDE